MNVDTITFVHGKGTADSTGNHSPKGKSTTQICNITILKSAQEQNIQVEYLQYIFEQYINIMNVDTITFVHGKGKRKTIVQKHYEKIEDYVNKLKKYAYHINVCGDNRNSYSKTDRDATFMRNKRDYMVNDQLLPSYNVQLGICDEYIAVLDVKQFASDMDCFVPLMEKFSKTYGFYPPYPVADAGYGSYNNYLYCEQTGMGKYMKFTMFKKETKDIKYHDDPFRAVNFKRNEAGNLICPNEKSLIIYTADLSKVINLAEQKNYINAKIVQTALIEKNAIKVQIIAL